MVDDRPHTHTTHEPAPGDLIERPNRAQRRAWMKATGGFKGRCKQGFHFPVYKNDARPSGVEA